MAVQSLDIVIKVKDAANTKLAQVGDNLDKLGKKAKNTDIDFTKFNRTLFTTTAFVLTFQRAFLSMFDAIEKGAEVDRLTNQFERVLGPKSQLFDLIKGFTDNSIDRFEAMRAGLELKSLGIVQNVGQVAELTARAGTAAKLAGKQSGEGIKDFAEFMKDGSVAHLEFLNLVARTNPALQAELAILRSSGKVMGGVIEKQFVLAVGQKLLYAATKGQMKGNRDLYDSVLDLKQAYFFLRSEIGTFVGRALAPLLDKISEAMDSFTKYLTHLRETDKNVMFLTKASISLGVAITGVAVAIGAIRLSLIALNSVGLGLPRLLFLVGSLTTAFMGLTATVDGFENKFKLFAAFFTGTWQLISSFLEDPENFAKGIGKIDKSIADLLRKNGLLNLATNIARLSSTIYLFVRDVGRQLIDWGTTAINIINKLIRTVTTLFGIDSGPWSRGFIDSGNKIRKWIVGATAAILPLFLAFKGIKFLFGGLLSKIPVIGGLFGGGGKGGPFGGPKGTSTDPIYTRDAGGVLGGILGKAGQGIAGLIGGSGLKALIGPILTYLGIPILGFGVGMAAADAILTKGSGPISTKIQGLMSDVSKVWGGKGIMTDEEAFAEGEKQFKAGKKNLLVPGAGNQTDTIIPTYDNQTDAVDNLFNQIKEIGDAGERKKAEMMAEAGLRNYQTDSAGANKQEKLLNMIAVLLANIEKNTKSMGSPSTLTSPRRGF